MEHNDEKKPLTTNIPNEKIPDQKIDFNAKEEIIVKEIKQKDMYVDEEDDVDIDEENQIMPANMCLLVENTLCDKKEDEWLIDEDSDHSIEFDLGISSTSKKYKEGEKTNFKTPELVNQKIKNSTFGSKINEPISNVKVTKEESSLASAKLMKHVQHLTNSTLNDLYRPPCSNVPGPSCSTNLPGPSSSINVNVPSSSNNLPGPSSLTSLPGPSNSTSLPGPSNSTSLPGPSDIFPLHQLPSLLYEDSNDTNLNKEQQVRLLNSFYNRIFLTGCDQENTEIDQEIEISHLKDCDYTKHYLLENTKFKYTDEEPEPEPETKTENTECFVEDPDIVNPDIMYNIDLNEYYNELDLLALKVLKTPEDPTGLAEYKQLPPIPEIEQIHRTFTVDERFRFANGISEWEYQIDRDDWIKIMVKRAVIFTAHAGFSIANEESLYVLADVAIDYVKKLAIIMKKHFDIQADSPHPDRIDPIDNSLQEIGVKGGVKELIEHYENDVFGRRNKLLKKCQHLKKLIDRQIVNKIKTKNVISMDLEEENSTYEVEENVLLKEIDTSIEEENTEIETGIEEVIIETQFSTDENIFTETEIEQIDPLYVDSTAIETKMDTGPKNIENIKINAMNIKDRKTNSLKIPDTTKIMEFDLLKPLDSVPTEYKKYAYSDGVENFTEWKYACGSESYPDLPKSEKSLDLGTPKKVTNYLYSPLGVSPKVQPEVHDEDENSLELDKMADQLDKDFEDYQTSFTEDNVQTIYIHSISDTDEPISLNDDDYADSIQIIPVTNENDDSDSNIDYDIVSVHSIL